MGFLYPTLPAMAAGRAGTSGWSYREWVGPFYPERTPSSRLLEHYAATLSTVEAHATYRRRPVPSTLTAWRAAVPDHFRFAPKAHAAITHQRELAGVEDRVAAFFEGLATLGPQLGPVMFQLPHRQPDLLRLDRLLAAIPDRALTAFELHPDWHVPEVLTRLDGAGATLVLVDADGAAAPDIEVGAFAYVRLRRHGYGEPELAEWIERLQRMRSGGRDVYVYVRHDDAGVAPQVASRLQEALTDH